jgi:23S rRNA (pseudouridine1915-N3)-methyltransferase
MKLQVLTIGKPKLAYAAAGVAEYEKRLRRFADLEVVPLKARDESSELLNRSQGAFRIVLDERGQRLTTDGFVDLVNRLEARGDIKSVAFLIGGADGHSQNLRDSADELISLSSLTLQHELALVVLLEQIYRAYAIKRGEPYHRA